jgi:uncharacterized protein YfaS (alpha-2-macroglobulin family)
VDENSNAAFDIVYADAKGEKKAVSGLQVRLIRERRDFQRLLALLQIFLIELRLPAFAVGPVPVIIAALADLGKVSFPVEWGSYRLEVKGPDDVVSSVRFWAGYSLALLQIFLIELRLPAFAVGPVPVIIAALADQP